MVITEGIANKYYMVIYIIIFFYLVVLAYVYDYRKNSIGKIYFIYLTLLIFILFSGLRYRVGIDTSRYEIFFNECPTLFTLNSYQFDGLI